MKNNTINCPLFNFKELSIDSQDKATADYLKYSADHIRERINDDMDNYLKEYIEEKGYFTSSLKIQNDMESEYIDKVWNGYVVSGFVENAELLHLVRKVRDSEDSRDGSPYFLDEMISLLEYGQIEIEVNDYSGSAFASNWFDSIDYVLKNTDFEREYLNAAVNQLEEMVECDFVEIHRKLKRVYPDVSEFYQSDDYVSEELEELGESFLEDGTLKKTQPQKRTP